MKKLVLLLFACSAAFGQIRPIDGTQTLRYNHALIDSNFAWLNANKLHYAGVWTSGVTYNVQDLVVFDGRSYISAQSTNTGNAPNTAPAWWVPVSTQTGVNVQTGVGYAVQQGDCGKLLSFSNATGVTVTMPQAGTNSSFTTNCIVDVENVGAGAVSILPLTSSIDGQTSLSLTQNQGVRIFSDGTNYFTQRGVGGAGGNGTGTVTHASGALTLGALLFGNAAGDIKVGNLSGDVTTTNSGVTTLATVNTTTGPCGDATHVCQTTTDSKGRVIAQQIIAITGTSGGGTGSNATTIQGYAIGAPGGAPQANQSWCWNTADGQFELSYCSSGSIVANQLQDFAPSLASGSLTLNPLASNNTPTIVKVAPNEFYRGITPAAVSVTQGSGSASDLVYVYLADNGSGTAALYAGSKGSTNAGVTISCTFCTALTGVTGFPVNSIPLFTWTVTNGALVNNGLTDYRSFLGTPVAAGVPFSTPATSSAPCTVPQATSDATFAYFCTAPNTWKRVALSTF